ncbi:uncharacterized protein [Nicotiana tomentosiformis]|uniref:uncharacterized protein n=1 Tax=Nicotiana tomentosiformis TaxID=4098 RepID=UPI00388CE7AE
MDLEITRNKRKRAMYRQHRIKWGALMEAKAWELGVKLVTMVAWMSSRDASAIWTMIVQRIREAVREVLGVSKGYSSGHKRNWWWNGEVREKVETKKAAYLKLVKSVDEEEKRANRRIRVDEVKGAMRKMSRGKVTGPDEIPVEFWKSAGKKGIEWITRLFNVMFRTKKMLEEWR